MDIEAILSNHFKWLNGIDGGLRAELVGVDLRGIDLSGANLKKAIFKACNFTGANLSNANMVEATALSCNFSDANLSNLKADGADLRGSNFTGAVVTGMTLNGARKTGIKGLDLIETLKNPMARKLREMGACFPGVKWVESNPGKTWAELYRHEECIQEWRTWLEEHGLYS